MGEESAEFPFGEEEAFGLSEGQQVGESFGVERVEHLQDMSLGEETGLLVALHGQREDEGRGSDAEEAGEGDFEGVESRLGGE